MPALRRGGGGVNPITESRQALVTVLEPLGVYIYGAPPENVSLPAAVVVPGADWMTQFTFSSLQITWQVTLMATMQGFNAAALERLETLIWDARTALEAVGLVGDPTTPRIIKIGPSEVAASDLPVQVRVTTGD